VETVARSWLIWELTGSATLLATVNLLRAIPMLILSLLAGVAAGRFDKRKLLIVTKSITLTNYLIMATLITTGAVQVWHVLASAFVMGSSMAFEQPTRTSLVPSLVGKDELTNAVALNSAAMNITRVAGPAAAGLLIAPLGVGGVYYASAGVYIGTLIATIMMRVPPARARDIGTSA
jgi:predicted MFS family arabinose efflux permease